MKDLGSSLICMILAGSLTRRREGANKTATAFLERVEKVVDGVALRHPELRKARGRRIAMALETDGLREVVSTLHMK